jgi:hypothetical protein
MLSRAIAFLWKNLSRRRDHARLRGRDSPSESPGDSRGISWSSKVWRGPERLLRHPPWAKPANRTLAWTQGRRYKNVREIMKRKTKSQSSEPSDDEFAVAVLCSFRQIIKVYLALAREGDSTLIRELPLHARQIVVALDEITSKYPDLIAEQAQRQVAWPIMAARHYPKESDFKRLAERIKLGSKTVVNLSPRARYKLKTPINRFLLTLLEGSIATPKDFYFVQLPDNLPKVTPKTVPYYLDDFIMPALDEIREKEGSWDGIPAVAHIVKGIAYESEHRSAVRNRIKRALKAMAAPER